MKRYKKARNDAGIKIEIAALYLGIKSTQLARIECNREEPSGEVKRLMEDLYRIERNSLE